MVQVSCVAHTNTATRTYSNAVQACKHSAENKSKQNKPVEERPRVLHFLAGLVTYDPSARESTEFRTYVPLVGL